MVTTNQPIDLGGNMTKTVIYAIVLAAISSTAIYAQEDQPDSTNRRQVQELVRNTETKAMFEQGRKGSSARRPAKSFSGKPVFPIAKFGGAQQGDPGANSNPSPSSVTTSIEIQSARFALVETSSSGPVSARSSVSEAMSKTGKSTKGSVVDYNDPRAQMIAPIDGSSLYATQSFAWSAGYGVGDYFLEIGSCFECNDLLSEDEGQNLSRTVPLPVDGRSIYVTLFSWISGNWYYIDYQYQASQAGNAFPAAMISPANGSTLNSQQTFAWDGGYGVNAFYLQIGSCQGCNDIVDENEGQSLSRTVSLPSDGRTVFARLFSAIQGTWWYYDYQYRAPFAQPTQHVRVNIVNNLAYAVNVSVNGTLVGSCPAFTTAGKDVDVSTLTVSFSVIQPTLNGNTLGDPMSGVFSTYDNASGTYNFTVGNHIGNTDYFLPLITNHTYADLEIEVNGGLQAENRCNCITPAGGTRVATGYYLWYSNSNVRLFENGTNYSGRYIYFGVDSNGAGTSFANFVKGSDAEIELVANQAP
jgi:hypothetical protein